ncbi:methylated-DNA--[protein]-cysteine S-methyltransferase [bacterium]|jgi:methylated-DNA-[protein]-cysteine S-methyltransferase|nr:methylated-DNA--[protein]-cysteine S-methyltransferase [bacterium]
MSAIVLEENKLACEPGIEVSFFSTGLGFMGLVTTSRGLVATRVGYPDEESLIKDLTELAGVPPVERKSKIARRLMKVVEGESDSLTDIELDLRYVTGGNWTTFRAEVTRLCRSIPAGQVWTYLELAEKAGAPRGARAAGSVMARNPWPIVVPCHRVVGSGGSLGGYSSPMGLDFKRELLGIESRP